MCDLKPLPEQRRNISGTFRTGLLSTKGIASPLLEDAMADSIAVSRRLQAIKSSNTGNSMLPELNPVRNKLNERIASETFTNNHPENEDKQIKQPVRVPNGSLSISSGDSCSISNFSGSNSRLSNNSGCSISSDEHEGIWTKLQGRIIHYKT